MVSSQILSLKQLPAFCKTWVTQFANRQMVLLDGPLGAGKTQFVKECVRALGGEMPDSPTFSVINTYHGTEQNIYHVDLYRLESDEDIESTGFWDLFHEDKGLIFIEWSNKISDKDWPITWQKLHVGISFLEDKQERKFDITTGT